LYQYGTTTMSSS